jgi:hypothetical protein
VIDSREISGYLQRSLPDRFRVFVKNPTARLFSGAPAALGGRIRMCASLLANPPTEQEAPGAMGLRIC